jgi:hypothetical protein
VVRLPLRFGFCFDQLGNPEGRRRGKAADQYGLPGAAQGAGGGEAPLDVAEHRQGQQGNYHRPDQRLPDHAQEKIRRQRDQAAGDVGQGDGGGADAGALRLGLFQPQLEPHHEVHPFLLVGAQGVHGGGDDFLGQAVFAENQGDLGGLLLGHFARLALLAGQLRSVVLGVGARRQVAAQAHGNGPGGDFREPGGEDQAGVGHRARQPGGQGERHRQAVGHTDDDVADGFRGGEVLLDVRGLRHTAPFS